jgi:hypothetical protein
MATVTVQDTVPPMAVCQDITIQLDGSGNASITTGDIDNGSSDNCAIDSLRLDRSSFTCSDIPSQSVTLTAVDVNGNSASCMATVTVQDTVPPVAVCQDITIQLDSSGNASITTGDIDNGSSDNCAIDSLRLDRTSFTCSDVLGQSVTLTAVDVNGNSASCSATVTVNDTIPPMAYCRNATIYLDGSGNANLMAASIHSSSSDNCGIDLLSLNRTSFTCSDVPSQSVTLTAIDIFGNSASCTAIVTIVDTLAPTAVCQDITIQLDGSGNASITTGDIDNGSSDNCAIDSLSLDRSTFTCSDIPSQTVTLTAVDVNGNSASCMATVTVQDTVPPMAICQDITIQLDGSGNASITTGDIDNGSSDKCAIDSLSLDRSAFTCTDIPSQTVTLTAVDVNGNSATCMATVTVQDTVPPMAVCQNITIQLDGSGNASITTGDIDNGSSDNCAIDSLSLDRTNFTCSDIPSQTVTLTAVDVNGNSASCMATVTVQDTVPPMAICQDITIQLDGSGNASITTGDIDNGSSDNCAIDSLSLDRSAFSCSDIPSQMVTLTAVDVNGNSASCMATVTVQDTVPPMAVCQDITIQLDGSGNASITTGDIDNGSSDNCAIDSLSLDRSAFTCTDIPSQTVTLTAVDVNGNNASCTATVTVQDTVPPMAVCQDVTVYLDANGNASITTGDIDNGSSDNCTIDSLSLDRSAFACTDVPSQTVTLTAVDVNGNTASCMATVTVQDTVPPIALCQDITIQLDGSGNASITTGDIDNGSSDNCAIDSLSLDRSAFTCSDIPSQTVTLTAVDVNGNSASCNATVTVSDTVSPVAVCQDITIQLDGSGNARITTGDIDNGSSDNCAIDSLSLDRSAFSCSDIPSQTVTFTAVDVNGNSASCMATVTVQDTVPPMAVCQDVTVYLDANGNASITTGDIDNGSSDNCAIDSLSLDRSAFTCSGIPSQMVTHTAVDVNGNSASCMATVTVQDTVPPVAICQDITIQLDGSGNASITTGDIDNGSSDNCAIDSLSLDRSAFTCSDIPSQTVTLTAVDVNGNSASCMATVTVQDTVPPIAICQDITIQLDGSGNASITTSDIDNGSSDNCAIDSLSLDRSAFSCSDIPSQMVTLTAVDVNGNSASCMATVTVQDTVPPTAVCQDITIQLDGSGNASITTGDIDNASSDNCAIGSLSLSRSAFACTDVPSQTVTLTAVDVNGNSASCMATVTVQDTVPPVVVCHDVTVYLDANGNASITTGDIDNGSNDNCAIDSLSLDRMVFSCADIPAQSISLAAFDVNGNSASCSATVTIIDSLKPTPNCSNATVYLDSLGIATVTLGDVDNNSSDNCSYSLFGSLPSFGCSELGPNTVTLVITDPSGNLDSCSSIVMVVDTVVPSFTVPPADTVYTDSACNYDASVSITGDVTDEQTVCGTPQATFVDSVTTIPNTTNRLIFRTWTLDAGNGQQIVKTQLITVLDTTPVEFALLGANPFDINVGSGTPIPGFIARDNCLGDLSANVVVDSSQLDRTVAATYTIDYTLTYTDAAGNTQTLVLTRTVNVTGTSSTLILRAFICRGQQFNLAGLIFDYTLQAVRFEFYQADPNAGGALFAISPAFRGRSRFPVLITGIVNRSYWIRTHYRNGSFNDVEVQVVVTQCGGSLSPIVMLEGAYDATRGNMRNSLQQQNMLPATEPYTALGFRYVNGGGEQMLPAAHREPIVDWVVLELRDTSDLSKVVYSRAALLRSDGRVVDLDGGLLR